MSDPTIASWSRESDLLFALRQLREENELLKTKREWQGLTDEEKVEIQMLKWWDWEDTFDLDGYTRAIEQALKEKNA